MGVCLGLWLTFDARVRQGGPLSPLLTNILLHQLDRELEQRGHRFARYADDMIMLVRSERAAQRVMRSITRYLETALKLTVNPAKSKVAPMSECSFLGFTIKGKKIRWTDKSVAQFKHRVRELTGRSRGVSMDHRLHKLGQYVRGWTAYFGISEYYRPVPELDDWIRRRIRMCYWKQWRWVRTPAVQQALSNAWLKAQGLVSVKDMWCKAQGYTT